MLEALRKVMRDAAMGKGAGEAVPVECHPSMLTVLNDSGIPADGVQLGIEDECLKTRSAFHDRTKIVLIAKGAPTYAIWKVPSLRALFRGTDKAPPDEFMRDPQPEYNVFFNTVESHVMKYGAIGHTPFDEEFIDIYSTMRRRPDNKSLGFLHDLVWQATAFELGLRPWSEDEYTAIFRRLIHSAKTFKLGKDSRNYVIHVKPLHEGS